MINMKIRKLLAAPVVIASLLTVPGTMQAQSDDFGYELGISGEKKIASGLKFGLDASMRTQDDAEKIDRYTVGAELSLRLFQTKDKRFSLKANTGFEYMWTQKLQEKEDKYEDILDENGIVVGKGDYKGYNLTDKHWRNRTRTNLGLSASFNPNKRWSFSLKETVQYNHYCSVDSVGRIKYRYNKLGMLASEEPTFTSKTHKDCFVLRSKLGASYDIRNIPIDVFASVDYGCGLNYTTNKWKFTVGYDYKVSKTKKITLQYRYNTEDDDEEANGHLVGLSYKFEF